MGSPQVQLIRWDGVPTQEISDKISLQVVWGDKATLARFCFAKGTHTPAHKHEAEQHTYLVQGKMEMRLAGQSVNLLPGQILVIPSGVEHEAWFYQDSVVLDFFSPARADWARGEYAYLRELKLD